MNGASLSIILSLSVITTSCLRARHEEKTEGLGSYNHIQYRIAELTDEDRSLLEIRAAAVLHLPPAPGKYESVSNHYSRGFQFGKAYSQIFSEHLIGSSLCDDSLEKEAFSEGWFAGQFEIRRDEFGRAFERLKEERGQHADERGQHVRTNISGSDPPTPKP